MPVIQKMLMPKYLPIKTHGTYPGAQTEREGEWADFAKDYGPLTTGQPPSRVIAP
jgi:hypothetical protein